MAQEAKGYSILSKKRYQDLHELYSKTFSPEQVDIIMDGFKTIMNFDPTISTYTKEKGIKNVQRRKDKSKETGTSQYVLGGNDKIYARKQREKKLLKDNEVINGIR